MHAECQPDPGHVSTDPAEPEQAERRAGEIGADRFRPLTAGTQRDAFGHQVACQAQDQRPGEFGGRPRTAGSAADCHAVPGRRGQVDRRVAETGCHQQPQAGESLEQALWECRSLAHDHDDSVVVQHLRQLRLVRDVLAQRANCDAITDGRPVRECGRRTLIIIQDSAVQRHLGHLIAILLTPRYPSRSATGLRAGQPPSFGKRSGHGHHDSAAAHVVSCRIGVPSGRVIWRLLIWSRESAVPLVNVVSVPGWRVQLPRSWAAPVRSMICRA